MIGLNDWDLDESPELNLKDMDDLIKEMREARELYDEKKKASTDAYKDYAALETKVMLALEAAGKKSYKVDGLGTFTIVEKRVVTTAKTIEAKRKLYDWIQDKYGEEYLISILGVNHNTLNSFYNREYNEYVEKAKAAQERGETIEPFDLPLPEPTLQKSTSFRKAAK